MKRKRITALLLAVLMVLTAMPMGALTVSAATSGYYTYEVENGEATITECDTSISGAITIPSTLGGYPVTAIGDRAFWLCDMTSVTIPSGVKTIGDYAFDSCDALTSVTIPSSVKTIGINPFSVCNKLTTLSVNSLNTVYHTKNNNLIETATNKLVTGSSTGVIPEEVTVIGDQAFSGCFLLKSITIPNHVTTIGDQAFEWCYLTSITIPRSVRTIGINPFVSCGELETITVDEGNPVYHAQNNCLIESATNKLISGCQTSVIPEYVTTIGHSAFYHCDTLVSITIPDSVTVIEESAFRNCDSLISVTIPGSVKTIGKNAFYWCNALETVVLSHGVTTIGAYAFELCGSLKSITIPSSVTTIEMYAFFVCNALETVYYEGKESDRAAMTIGSANTDLTDATWYYGTSVYGEFRYVLTADGTVSIVDYLGTEAETVIPHEINGYTVSTIADGAFDGATLSHVYFTGTKKQWVAVTVGSGNDPLASAHIHYGTDGTDHWTLKVIATPSTCLTSGNGTYSCACGYSDERSIPATGHTHVAVEVVAPTCIEGGYTVYRCEDCTDSYQADPTAATGHTYVAAEVVAPTCTEDGYTVYRCKDCTDHYQADPTPAQHDRVAVETVAPTCTKGGYTVYRCQYCDNQVQSDLTAATGHTHVAAEVIAPTCTEDGYTVYRCENCTNNYQADPTTATGHTYVATGVMEPTCTEDGYKTLRCEDCGGETQEPLAAAHRFQQNVCVYCRKDVSQCLASEHPYSNNTDMTFTVRQPDAETIVLTFAAECELDDGFDFVYIYDENGDLVGTYTGTQLAGASVEVPGEGATIRLVSDDSMVYHGFAVTDVKATVKEPAIPKGDVNGDGDLTTADARMIMLHALEGALIDEAVLAYADYNGDGEVNTADARLIMLYALMN